MTEGPWLATFAGRAEIHAQLALLGCKPARGATFARVIAWERRGFDGPRHWRITYPAAMTRDAIMAELLEIEGLLQDDRLNDDDRHALHGGQQALRNILSPRPGTKPLRHSTGLTISRAKPFPCFCTSLRGTAP